jgi:hypothetical protein
MRATPSGDKICGREADLVVGVADQGNQDHTHDDDSLRARCTGSI